MDSDASDNYEDLYNEEDAPKHEKLVDKVLSLNKTQHLKKPSRTEPTLQVSEFDLVKSITGDKGSVHLNELTKSLKHRKSRITISENVQKAQRKSHTLPKPLEKPQANRIRRTVAYEKTRLQLDKWESTITSNRVSTNLSFPLDNDLKIERKEAQNFASMYRLKSKLDEELEKHQPVVEEHHIDLEQEKFPLSMKEMMARRQEAAKLRAFQGYKEAKARRQNKIKSKKYHRIQKRERIKQKLKEFELLQKTNPEEALKKLEEIEKTRVEERFSLRHKGTGKWARGQQIRAKYDKESRQVLAEQLMLSRDLTQKLKSNESDSEEEKAEAKQHPVKIDESNPWINGVKPGQEVSDFLTGYRKYWLEKNKQDDATQNDEEAEEKCIESKEVEDITDSEDGRNKEGIDNNDNSENNVNAAEEENEELEQPQVKKKKQKRKVKCIGTSDWDVSFVKDDELVENLFDKLENKLQKKMLSNVMKLKNKLNRRKSLKEVKKKHPKTKKVDLSMPLQKKVPIIDEELITDADITQDNHLTNLKTILASHIEPKRRETENIDPNKYINVKPTNLSTAVPDLLTTEENDEDVNQRELISEAFEDDDIVDDFAKDKKDEVKKNKPKNVNLNLPGWGSWGGTNVPVNKRKRRRFTLKAPPKVRRRDDNKGSLIINETAQSKIKEHQVSEVPFPFKNVQDFEASMRAPISNTFVPERAYKKLIQPALTTKMGTIIEPMSREILVNKN